jgi:chorismate mutase
MNHEYPDLETLRNELQALDLQILLLLLDRFKLTHDMGQLKKEQKMDAFQEGEWQRKINLLSDYLEGNPFTDEILRVFYHIHNESVRIQEKSF